MSQKTEEWEVINGFENYAVSNMGRVVSYARSWRGGQNKWRSKAETIFPAHYSKFGYNHLNLLSSGKKKDLRVCRLVAVAFVPNPHNYPVVNHIDGDKTNDCADNLEWATHKANTQHAFKIGLMSGQKGESNSRARITEQQAISVINHLKKGNSIGMVALHLSISKSIVSQIKSGRRWKHLKR